MEDFVTAARVADFLAYKNVESVYRLAAQEGFPSYAFNGQRRFLLSEVRAWVDRQNTAGQAAVVQLRERGAA